MSQENLSSGFLTRSETDRTVQSQKIVAWYFRFRKVEGLYDQCSENKGGDWLYGAVQLVLHLCFRICKFSTSCFSQMIPACIKLRFDRKLSNNSSSNLSLISMTEKFMFIAFIATSMKSDQSLYVSWNVNHSSCQIAMVLIQLIHKLTHGKHPNFKWHYLWHYRKDEYFFSNLTNQKHF